MVVVVVMSVIVVVFVVVVMTVVMWLLQWWGWCWCSGFGNGNGGGGSIVLVGDGAAVDSVIDWLIDFIFRSGGIVCSGSDEGGSVGSDCVSSGCGGSKKKR